MNVRKFMILSTIGRILSLCGMFGAVSSLFVISPLVFSFVTISALSGSAFSSTAQVMAAADLSSLNDNVIWVDSDDESEEDDDDEDGKEGGASGKKGKKSAVSPVSKVLYDLY